MKICLLRSLSFRSIIFPLVFTLLLSGCFAETIGPTGARLFHYHISQDIKDIETLITRLYTKNPKYQLNPVLRQKRIEQIFHGKDILDKYAHMSSDKVLAEAFAPNPMEHDRVYLLGLGMVKSIKEAYGVDKNQIIITALQIPLERLQRLAKNLSQVNWRMKTYKDAQGELLFRSNAVGEDGYMNMGYEVIMTTILTRVRDDIYMRGGLPGKYFFDMSTLFVSIVI